MFTSSNNPTYPESGFLPWLKDSLFGVVKYKRTHPNKLPMVRICLLFVMIFVGYEAIFEYAKLQRTNAADSELINNYSQSVVTLTNRYNDINNALAKTNLSLAPNGSTQSTAIQQLSSYVTNVQVREFTSYDDLVAWMKQDDTHEQVYSPTFECVDFAFMMSEHAAKDGYWILPAVDLADGHMQCIAPIGQDLYAIEPQTNAVSLWAVKSDH